MLDGSPYSLADDRDSATEVSRLLGAQHDLSRRLTKVIAGLRKAGLFAEQQRSIRTTEVYESNALEGVGTDLPETFSILSSQLADEAISAVKRGMLLTSLTSERKVLDVIGLNTARELAKRIADQASARNLTQADIRMLHSMIQTGEYTAGAYRARQVGIKGSTHCPPDAFEVQRSMSDLVDWCDSKRDSMPAVLHAAVVHGWLTHIHPFDDGNGRTARIVVNILMSQLGLPLVIVRHGADRGTYLDALALSDVAGNILPFAGVFLRTQKRLIRQMEKPAFLRQIFNDEVLSRGDSMYDFWKRVLSEFIDSLVGALSLYKIRAEQVGEVDRTSYELIRDGDPTGNMWLLRLADQNGCELLIWLGHSSWRTASVSPDSKHLPALYFSVRSPTDRIAPYQRIFESGLGGLREVVIVPDMQSEVYAAFSTTLKRGGISDSADYIAEQIGHSFSRGEIARVTAAVAEQRREIPRVTAAAVAEQRAPAERWRQFARSHAIGEIVPGKVTKLVPFGAFVRLEERIEGLVHISELAEWYVEVPDQVVAIGDDAMVKIIDIDLERRRISLSLKQANEDYTEELDPAKYGMADEYDEQGNYIFPEGFDPETNKWLEGFDTQRAEWEARYAETERRHKMHTAQMKSTFGETHPRVSDSVPTD